MQYYRRSSDAVAPIHGGIETPQLSGCIQFYQENGSVLIVTRISGLPMESEIRLHYYFTKGCKFFLLTDISEGKLHKFR